MEALFDNTCKRDINELGQPIAHLDRCPYQSICIDRISTSCVENERKQYTPAVHSEYPIAVLFVFKEYF